MSVKRAIRMVLAKRDMNQAELSSLMGCSQQSFSNKSSRNSWTAADLVKIAKYTGCTLTFVFPDGQQIPIIEDDPEFSPPAD